MTDKEHIVEIILDETLNIKRSPDIENERATAIADLLHQNKFSCPDISAPYKLKLSLRNRSVHIFIGGKNTNDIKEIDIYLLPFKGLIKDYFIVCENYYKLARQNSYGHIEAIDMGRRALHDEAAELLKDRLLHCEVKTDLPTARRLFTLICVLHIRVMY